MKYAMIFIMLLTACTSGTIESTGSYSDIDRVVLAITSSPTFAFDGKNLTLVESGNEMVFAFTSDYAGYGDRSGIVLPFQETTHRVVVRVESGTVVSMVIDGFWDELAQQPLVAAETVTATARYAVTCIDEIPDPIINYQNSSVVITHFAKGCGERRIEHSFDNGVFPPTLNVRIHDANGECPANCSTGVSTFIIPAEEVGAIIIDDGKSVIHSFGRFYCKDETCPRGYFCAKPERGGICVINSTESEEVLYERYIALQD
jgi:hypothetical protein